MARTAFSINEVNLIGNVGKEPEVKFINDDLSVMNFSVATVESIKRGDNYEKKTSWHNITVFNPSDFITNKLVKGSKIFLKGKIDYQTWEKDGEKKYSTKIIADFICPLDKNEAGANSETTSQTETNDDLPF